MRIVTWNCARGPLGKKLDALHTLEPDVAVLCEAPPPEEENDCVAWFPSTAEHLGVQVRPNNGYTVERLLAPALPCCTNSIRIHGPTSFNLLAVWTWPAPSYVEAFANGLEEHADLLGSGPSVGAGDFNGNPGLDKPRQRVKWADAFTRLEKLGLVSAYHHLNRIAYGAEPDPTHLHLRKAERPFHIDFCFIPRPWTEGKLFAQVERATPWATLSDHYPLIVDCESSHREGVPTG